MTRAEAVKHLTLPGGALMPRDLALTPLRYDRLALLPDPVFSTIKASFERTRAAVRVLYGAEVPVVGDPACCPRTGIVVHGRGTR